MRAASYVGSSHSNECGSLTLADLNEAAMAEDA